LAGQLARAAYLLGSSKVSGSSHSIEKIKELVGVLVNLGLTSNPVGLLVLSSAGLPIAKAVKESESKLN
jgi:hypothetical protein